MKSKFRFLTLVFAIIIFSSTAFPCSYVNDWSNSKPPCWKYNNSDLVALGKVVKTEIIKVPEGKYPAEYQIIDFKIKERFKGNSEKTIRFKIPQYSCSSTFFNTNDEFIVYSSNDEDNAGFYRMKMGFTMKEWDDFKKESDYLKLVKKGKAGATISGVVIKSFREYFDNGIEREELKDVEVFIKSEGSEYKLKTDKDGKFLLYGLDLKEYEVSLNILDWKGKQLSKVFDLREESCQNVWASVATQGNVTGVLLTPDGNFASNVELELVAFDPETNSLSDESLTIETDNDGSFDFSFIPQGKYMIAHNYDNDELDEKTYSRSFYPGVKDFNSSSIIEIKDKQSISLGIFQLPSKID